MPPKNVEEFHVFVVRRVSVRNPSLVRNIQFASDFPRTWLFQSNPQLYDLRAALRSLKEHVWSVSRYAKEIRMGDCVYLWEAGTRGGIIGLAEVTEPPCRRPEPWEQLPFIRAHELFLKERVRTKLKISRVFDPVIDRGLIVGRPEFRELSVLRCSRGTNFRLSAAETEALRSLILERAA